MAFDKTKPAGTIPLKTSDDQIRANNEALETAIGQDHDFATCDTQTGKHEKITFKAPLESKPTLSTDECAIYPRPSVPRLTSSPRTRTGTSGLSRRLLFLEADPSRPTVM